MPSTKEYSHAAPSRYRDVRMSKTPDIRFLPYIRRATNWLPKRGQYLRLRRVFRQYKLSFQLFLFDWEDKDTKKTYLSFRAKRRISETSTIYIRNLSSLCTSGWQIDKIKGRSEKTRKLTTAEWGTIQIYMMSFPYLYPKRTTTPINIYYFIKHSPHLYTDS